jgi:hypothetical protein
MEQAKQTGEILGGEVLHAALCQPPGSQRGGRPLQMTPFFQLPISFPQLAANFAPNGMRSPFCGAH